MSDGSKIGWLFRPGTKPVSWNPVVGCSPMSPGCDNCYARKFARRGFSSKYKQVAAWDGTVFCDAKSLDLPTHWRKPRTVFVPSMGDLFHDSIPEDVIINLLATIALCPRHTFIALTKRAERMRIFLTTVRAYYYNLIGLPNLWLVGLPNLWLGISAENQEWLDKRLPYLLETPTPVRVVSLEPLLGPIDFGNRLDGIGWVIIGCESRGRSLGRECKLEWVESIIDQCNSADVPIFIKQLPIDGRLSRDSGEWPGKLMRQEWPGGGTR